MPLFDHFDIIAPLYDRVFKIQEPENLIGYLNLPISGALLDAGGGTGRVSETMRELVSSIVIADLSIEMLRKADDKDGLKTICSHTEFLPFPDESFERILMVDALHHVCNHRETSNDLWRVLTRGGRIVIEEPNINVLSVKMLALAEKLALMRSSFIPPSRIQSLFDYPNAKTRIEIESYNAWIIIDKT